MWLQHEDKNTRVFGKMDGVSKRVNAIDKLMTEGKIVEQSGTIKTEELHAERES